MGRLLPSLLEIVDPGGLKKQLAPAAHLHGEAQKRALVEVLKTTLAAGRAKARERLEQGAHRGRVCAESLCYLQDTIIRAVHTFALENVFPVAKDRKSTRLNSSH